MLSWTSLRLNLAISWLNAGVRGKLSKMFPYFAANVVVRGDCRRLQILTEKYNCYTFSTNKGKWERPFFLNSAPSPSLWNLIKESHKKKECPKKWKKSKRGGGSAPKIIKSTIQNVDFFEMRGDLKLHFSRKNKFVLKSDY